MNKISEDLEILNDFKESMEKLNFLSWYRGATAEDFEMARKNNSAKLDALTAKYSRELDMMGIVEGRKLATDERGLTRI